MIEAPLSDFAVSRTGWKTQLVRPIRQGLLDVMLLSRGGGFNFDAYAHRAWDAFWDGVRAR